MTEDIKEIWKYTTIFNDQLDYLTYSERLRKLTRKGKAFKGGRVKQ